MPSEALRSLGVHPRATLESDPRQRGPRRQIPRKGRLVWERDAPGWPTDVWLSTRWVEPLRSRADRLHSGATRDECDVPPAPETYKSEPKKPGQTSSLKCCRRGLGPERKIRRLEKLSAQATPSHGIARNSACLEVMTW